MITKSAFGGFIALFILTVSSHSQTRPLILQCVKDFYGIVSEPVSDDDLKEVALAPSLATQLLGDIVKASQSRLKPTAIDCDKVKNATILQPRSTDPLPSQLKERQFIVYNSVWMREVLGRDRTMAIFMLAHELGHISRRHLDLDLRNRIQYETEADFDGACAVARMGGKWSSLEELVFRIRGESDSEYPSATRSIETARRAFAECGGGIAARNNTQGVEVVYFFKRADDGKVVSTLNNKNIEFSARQSGIFAGTDFSDRTTDTVTCHLGAPIEFVKSIALALYDGGVEIRAISEPDPENKVFQNRVTIQSTTRTRPRLARADIERLSRCPDTRDPVYGQLR